MQWTIQTICITMIEQYLWQWWQWNGKTTIHIILLCSNNEYNNELTMILTISTIQVNVGRMFTILLSSSTINETMIRFFDNEHNIVSSIVLIYNNIVDNIVNNMPCWIPPCCCALWHTAVPVAVLVIANQCS